MNIEIVLKDWESNDFMLDDDLIIGDLIFNYVDEVKIYILKNKFNHNFLNKLNDIDKLSNNDYQYLMNWYYKRKTHVDTPEKREAIRVFFEQCEKEEYEKYQKNLELMKN
jgi:hypothetical protein